MKKVESMKTYIHYGQNNFDVDLFAPIENRPYFTKPFGGLWASRTDAKYSWNDWCRNNDFAECRNDNSFTFTLKDGAKVLEINSVKELKEVPKIKDDDGVTYTMIDFEKLSESYDAIEVNISSDHNLYFSLYGWDCDSILIMNPDIIQVGGV